MRNNRAIYTYYHHAQNFGLAQVHLQRIGEKVLSATKGEPEPHEVVIRLRSEHGSRILLQEVIEENRKALMLSGHASRGRTFRNSDGSLDAELRVETNGDFDETVLEIGEYTSWPRVI